MKILMAVQGNDTIRFTGNYSSYRINENTADVLTVRDLRDQFDQGDNDTQSVETFEFADESTNRCDLFGCSNWSSVRSWSANGNGGNVPLHSSVMPIAQAEIENLIDDIFAQANIDVIWEAAVSYNNTFANNW